ncbi:hypothetical protein PYCC9005_004121 [Savitreella phatthalungensis]
MALDAPETSHQENLALSQSDSNETQTEKREQPGRKDGKRVLTEDEAYDKLGFCFPEWKKWMIITVIFVVQNSMNLNASIYANGVPGISERYGVSEQAARVGQLLFLVMYAIGSEMWAGPSEKFGRFPVLQISLFLVNIWQIPAFLSPTFGGLLAARALGGLSSAGGSVTLGMIADMWEPEDQQYAVSFVVLSSVGGSVLGPVVGGFIQSFADYRWVFYVQLIFGGATQLIHLFLVPETRATILLDREAKRRRESGEDPNIWGPNEVEGSFRERWNWREFAGIVFKSFHMFFTEPIVLFLSLLSGFSDALIFIFLESYGLVFAQYNFPAWKIGLTFVALLVGYFIAYFITFPDIAVQRRRYKREGGYDNVPPERKLWMLLFLAPLEPIGLMCFAWTSQGPNYNSAWGPIISGGIVAVANFAIYQYTVEYMIAAYGPEAGASATGGNALARDALAGIAAMYSTPFYQIFDGHTLVWPSFILSLLGVALCIPIYVFYFKGEYFRKRSPYAQSLAGAAKERKSKRTKPEA